MMDILYLVGPSSGHDNRELRWSLRSVAKYARNVGRIVVAGYPPAWLAPEVVCVPVEDRPNESKFLSIWRKAAAAIESGAVRGEFLISCDDHFYTKPVDAAATPFYYRRPGLLRFEDAPKEAGSGNYWRHLAGTREALVSAGFPARDCAGHCNFRCDTRDWPLVKEIHERRPDEEKARALDLASAFANVRAMREHIDFVFRPDIKARSFAECHPETGQFSIGDKIFEDAAFLDYMKKEFGTPCRYEKETA